MPIYAAIDLKSFYASAECVERGDDPLMTRYKKLPSAADRMTASRADGRTKRRSSIAHGFV